MKVKEFIKKYFVVEAAIFVAVIIFDLVSKTVAKNNLDGGEPVYILGRFLHFRFLNNYGASYGMFSELEYKNVLFFCTTILGLAFFAGLMVYARKKSLTLRIGVILMAAGALGNAIDRLFMPDINGAHTFFNGGVRDFIALDFGFRPFQFVCNVADIAIFFGVIIFAVILIFFDKEQEDNGKKELRSN